MTRTRTIGAALAALVVTSGSGTRAARAIPGANGTVFVTERQFASVTALDAATGEAHWTSAVGAGPIGIVRPTERTRCTPRTKDTIR